MVASDDHDVFLATPEPSDHVLGASQVLPLHEGVVVGQGDSDIKGVVWLRAGPAQPGTALGDICDLDVVGLCCRQNQKGHQVVYLSLIICCNLANQSLSFFFFFLRFSQLEIPITFPTAVNVPSQSLPSLGCNGFTELLKAWLQVKPA